MLTLAFCCVERRSECLKNVTALSWVSACPFQVPLFDLHSDVGMESMYTRPGVTGRLQHQQLKIIEHGGFLSGVIGLDHSQKTCYKLTKLA